LTVNSGINKINPGNSVIFSRLRILVTFHCCRPLETCVLSHQILGNAVHFTQVVCWSPLLRSAHICFWPHWKSCVSISFYCHVSVYLGSTSFYHLCFFHVALSFLAFF